MTLVSVMLIQKSAFWISLFPGDGSTVAHDEGAWLPQAAGIVRETTPPCNRPFVLSVTCAVPVVVRAVQLDGSFVPVENDHETVACGWVAVPLVVTWTG